MEDNTTNLWGHNISHNNRFVNDFKWIFLSGAELIPALTMATECFQSGKAAIRNPTKAITYE